MKIRHSWRKGENVSIADAVAARIDDSSGQSGAVEAALDTSRNAAQAFGRLIEMLHAKDVLSVEDVKQFIGFAYVVEEE